jgi:hypothetical protein
MFTLAYQTVMENKKELEDLKAKLEAILSIVEKYKKHGGLRAINNRIENFCQCVPSCFSVIFHIHSYFPGPLPSKLRRSKSRRSNHGGPALPWLRRMPRQY